MSIIQAEHVFNDQRTSEGYIGPMIEMWDKYFPKSGTIVHGPGGTDMG